ncbi:peptidoglycan DD-metalloendopeptidase family protein [Streptomyces sp. S07_1.15]|uniref:peptidoglycan DD-metalloendopeptidase family protein n=1 Tax=Streptomyces sp. S07_1.15 TaxID=2873925 RepID=UPI001D1366C2|nr:peptidoglycan DD-metalloendopeptidase family protein [Streptomyces sp. S07_1.15]MCC3652186.1 peptidoglycan DD-metalloendopeptidase family protein [Streptomyces sp. S07_1.15]
MNDRHPSGTPIQTAHAPEASYGYYDPYGQQGTQIGYAGYSDHAPGAPGHHDASSYGDGDPLFGAAPAGDQHHSTAWDTGAHAQPYGPHSYGPGETGAHHNSGYDTGGYDTSGYDTGAHWTPEGHQATGQWESGAWESAGDHGANAATGSYPTADPYAAETQGYNPAAPYDTGQYATLGHDTGSYETAAAYGTAAGFDGSGQWDATAWQADGPAPADGAHHPAPEAEHERTAVFEQLPETAAHGEHDPGHDGHGGHDGYDPYDGYADANEAGHAHTAEDTDGGLSSAGSHGADPYTTDPYDPDPYGPEPYDAEPYDGAADGHLDPGHPDAEEIAVLSTATSAASCAAGPPPRRGGSGNRSRRRAPAKRSALLTVAVPSVAVMGVAGIAAASVGGTSADDSTTTQAAADEDAVKPALANNKLDTQLATLTADAGDFADRASRTQERIDLRERQAEEKRRKEEEAARKEALRPKFALPVAQKGLSAYYGQAGVNWMSVHSGIDFPVAYGTPVMAATDGTVRTQYNLAYGNMAIVTAPDGTETWYCHLSSTKIRSGTVKAGDTIAYAGNSGNSTGPHLHFEVRPGGGSAVDPLGWFQSHGLDPQ